MLIDDRLDTVVRQRTDGERARRTQFRQLVDLLGSAECPTESDAVRAAYRLLGELSAAIGQTQRAAMLSEPGVRIGNANLVTYLAQSESPVAAAAMARARLSASEWAQLLPQLPVTARGMLRHRRDLPDETVQMLRRLGVRDLVLPRPAESRFDSAIGAASLEPQQPESTAVFDLSAARQLRRNEPDRQSGEIGALVQRIEAFRKAREPASEADGPEPSNAPRLPLGDHGAGEPYRLQFIEFATDAAGRITAADGERPAIALPLLAGLQIASADPASPLSGDAATRLAFQRRQTLCAAVDLRGAPAIAGRWQLDATPQFAAHGGAFTGYVGCLRRMQSSRPEVSAQSTAADRMREMLHELKTPVNAIQGFAEVIHQQLFGPSPNEYRALAASIAADAARMMAGLDELDRLARLDSGALVLDAGTADLGETLRRMRDQLAPAIDSRGAALELPADLAPSATAIATAELDRLVWRILAIVAAALAPGERLALGFSNDGWVATVRVPLPHALAQREDIFAPAPAPTGQAIAAGMFGTGFGLRLARAEAVAAGGSLTRDDATMTLVVPLLTDTGAGHSAGSVVPSNSAA